MYKFQRLVALMVVVFVSFAGCKSKFEKIRTSTNFAKKYQEGLRLYKKKDYARAQILFEELSNRYRGVAQAENLNYYYAYTLYYLKDYTTARYQFKFFTDTYPSSQYAEECRYMNAYCYYVESPPSYLDQENTYKAIDAMQLFINLYPKSERVAKANEYIAALRGKLEEKAFKSAKLYYDMGSFDVSNYKAAVIAFKNVQRDFPDIRYIEEIDFLIIKAQYLFAKNSYEIHQENRYSDAIGFYDDFLAAHPNSKFLPQAQDLKKSSEQGIKSAQKILAAAALDREKYKKLYEKREKRDTIINRTILEENDH